MDMHSQKYPFDPIGRDKPNDVAAAGYEAQQNWFSILQMAEPFAKNPAVGRDIASLQTVLLASTALTGMNAGRPAQVVGMSVIVETIVSQLIRDIQKASALKTKRQNRPDGPKNKQKKVECDDDGDVNAQECDTVVSMLGAADITDPNRLNNAAQEKAEATAKQEAEEKAKLIAANDDEDDKPDEPVTEKLADTLLPPLWTEVKLAKADTTSRAPLTAALTPMAEELPTIPLTEFGQAAAMVSQRPLVTTMSPAEITGMMRNAANDLTPRSPLLIAANDDVPAPKRHTQSLMPVNAGFRPGTLLAA